LGPRDLESGQLVLVRRVRQEDVGKKGKEFLPEGEVISSLPARLEAFQQELLERARARREERSHRGVTSIEEMKEILDGPGGFVYTGWNGDPAVEARVKEETRATLRCLPDPDFQSSSPPARCVSGEGESRTEAVWARAY
ncbi:MAG: proline--tRNA ligase, partial [Gemmatimonadota bacterium]